MILTCPSCGTQYAVKDGAIPEGGRKVRCASCGHSWHQDPPADALGQESTPVASAEPAEPAEPAWTAEEPADPIATDAHLVEEPTSVPLPPPGAETWAETGGGEDDWNPADEIPDAEEIEIAESETGADRRRNWRMMLLVGLLVVVAIVAALWFLAPDSLRQQVGLAAASATPLQIAAGTPERQKLASGNELVVVSGRVINPSGTEQPVPPIEAQLRDSSGRVLYSWTIAPPTRTLPPGGSATFNSAEMDVPASGADSTVTLSLKG